MQNLKEAEINEFETDVVEAYETFEDLEEIVTPSSGGSISCCNG